jgi:hypothetical protein
MSTKIQTPVNDAINQAIGALEVARKAAEDSRDWHTWNGLSNLWNELISVREETTESQVNGVDKFFEIARQKRDEALPAWTTSNRSIEDMLG